MIRRKDECPGRSALHMKDGEGEVQFRDLASKEELLGHARVFSIITLQTGCSIGYHRHEQEAEYFYCLSGTPTVNDNGTEVLLYPGDVAINPDGNSHSLINKTDTPCEVLALVMLK